MSYLEFKEQEEKAFKQLSAEDFNITNVINTMHKLYQQGAMDADIEWRTALAKYCNNHSIPFKNIFCELFTILNKK